MGLALKQKANRAVAEDGAVPLLVKRHRIVVAGVVFVFAVTTQTVLALFGVSSYYPFVSFAAAFLTVSVVFEFAAAFQFLLGAAVQVAAAESVLVVFVESGWVAANAVAVVEFQAAESEVE